MDWHRGTAHSRGSASRILWVPDALRGDDADYPALPGLWLSLLDNLAAAGRPRRRDRLTLVRPVRGPALVRGLRRRATRAPIRAGSRGRTASAGTAGSPRATLAGRPRPADSRSCTAPAARVDARQAAVPARARRSRPSRDR